jgi:hypothetical protein
LIKRPSLFWIPTFMFLSGVSSGVNFAHLQPVIATLLKQLLTIKQPLQGLGIPVNWLCV